VHVGGLAGEGEGEASSSGACLVGLDVTDVSASVSGCRQADRLLLAGY
jgi:hypothetical protein